MKKSMKLKYRNKKDKKLYFINKKSLFEKGFRQDNLVINTWDYDYVPLLNEKIKDFKKKDLERLKDKDKEYFDTQINNNIYKDIKYADYIYGDWWRVGDIKKDKMFYVTISNPYLRELNDIEIKSLIKEHYHFTFGYKDEFYIPFKFQRVKKGKDRRFLELKRPENIVDSDTLIENWLENNKNSKEYKFYKDLIVKTNEISLKQKDIKIEKNEKYGLIISIPFNCELTYLELFEKVLNSEFKYSHFELEDEIKKYFDDKREFLYMFKPQKLYKKSIKIRKLRTKNSKQVFVNPSKN